MGRHVTCEIAYACSAEKPTPTKQALAAELLSRQSTAMIRRLEPKLLALAAAPLADGARELVRIVIAAHVGDAPLMRALLHEARHNDVSADVEEFLRRATVGFRMYLEAHRASIRPRDLDLAVLILTHSVEAAIHAAVVEHPHPPAEDELANELCALVLGYLGVRGPAT